MSVGKRLLILAMVLAAGIVLGRGGRAKPRRDADPSKVFVPTDVTVDGVRHVLRADGWVPDRGPNGDLPESWSYQVTGGVKLTAARIDRSAHRPVPADPLRSRPVPAAQSVAVD